MHKDTGVVAITETTSIELIGSWGENKERLREKIFHFRPLLENYALCISIKNNGSTPIDHFTWQQTSSLAHMNIELLNPRVPSQLWRPFAGNIVSATFRRHVRIRNNSVGLANPDLGQPIEVSMTSPVPKGSIEPGETFTILEKEKSYLDYLREGTEARAPHIGAVIDLEIADAHRGLLDFVIKEFKLGPINFHDIRLQIELKGKIGAVQEVLIDDQIHDRKKTELTFL